jgi:FlaA1/EpsC-like NDP-sugar epimerase
VFNGTSLGQSGLAVMELSGVARISQTLEADMSFVPKNILITGGAGFIGSHVVSRLVAKYPQYKVCVTNIIT